MFCFRISFLYHAILIMGIIWIYPVSISSAGPSRPDTSETMIEAPVFQGRAYLYEAGKQFAKSVVLVHGLGAGASRDWEMILPSLAEKYHVLAFDLPGFGRSDGGNKLYSPENYVAFMKSLINRLAKVPIHLIGHSMGGAISLRYAASHPDDVDRLVLIDASGILHRHAYSRHLVQTGIRKIPSFHPLQEGRLRQFAGTILERISGKPIPDDLILYSALTREKILQGDPAKIAAFSLAVDDISPIISNVRTPALIIWGEKDDIAPVRTGKMLAALIPDSELRILGGIGHSPIKESPDQVKELILGHLEKKSDSATVQAKSSSDGPPKKNGRCEDREGMVFEGGYDTIEIVNCRNAILKNVKARSLLILDSEVEIEKSDFNSPDETVIAFRSKVIFTGGKVEGDVAITSKGSKFDIAGTMLVGKSAALKSIPDDAAPADHPAVTSVLFSVTPVQSPHSSGYRHGPFSILPEKPL